MCFSIYAFLKINVVIGYVLEIDEAYRPIYSKYMIISFNEYSNFQHI